MNQQLKTFLLCVATALVTGSLLVGIGKVHWSSNSPALVIDGPVTSQLGDILEYKASVKDSGWFLDKVVYQWKVLNNVGEVKVTQMSDDHIFFPAGLTAGKDYVVCSATLEENYIVWTNVVPLDMRIVPVQIGGVTPGPTPPGPNPPVPPAPTPTPVTDKLWAVAIFDNTQAVSLTKDQLAVHNGTEEMQGLLKPFDVIWKNYDKVNPALADSKWQEKISSLKLPSVVFVNKDGKVYGDVQADQLNKTNVTAKAKSIREGK